MTSEAEACSVCGKTGRMPLARRTQEGEDQPLCEVCACHWLEENSDWPKQPTLFLAFPPHERSEKNQTNPTK